MRDMASEADREEHEILELGLDFEPVVESSSVSEFIGFSLEILDLLPDVYFWKKDQDGRYTYASQSLLKKLKKPDVIGMKDEELYSPEFVKLANAEDKKVMELKTTLKNKPELVPCVVSSNVEWRELSKMPITDDNNKVIGLVGMSRPIPMSEGVTLATHYREIIPILAYIYQNIDKEISVVDVAKHAEVSASTLERIFKKHFGITPKKWIAQAKISVVCEYLLESDASIQSIATKMGYDDHGNFTRAYVAVLGMTPRDYRKKYGSTEIKKNLK